MTVTPILASSKSLFPNLWNKSCLSWFSRIYTDKQEDNGYVNEMKDLFQDSVQCPGVEKHEERATEQTNSAYFEHQLARRFRQSRWNLRRLTSQIITKSSQDSKVEMQPDRDGINQDGEGFDFGARGLTTAVVTQRFSYIVGKEHSTAMFAPGNVFFLT